MDYNTPPQIPMTAGFYQTGNPWFNLSNQFTPRNLHDIIRWARYITTQSPTTTEVIRKLATYPITEFTFDTKDLDSTKKYSDLTKSLKLKEFLQDVGFEYHTIGNCFVSIYFPILRTLVCRTCKTTYSAKRAGFLKFKNYEFTGTCPHCNASGTFERIDTKSVNLKEINLIKWTPEHIAVNHNPITGEKEFFYKVPNVVKQKIIKGDRLFIDSVPWEFVEAVRYNQDFKFEQGHIFHLQNISSGGTVEGIAVPPLLSLFSLVFYQATLRKANEAIASEYLNPMRVVFPQAGNGQADPIMMASIRNFRMNVEEAIKIHKRDKNYFMISPVPLGYQAVGGEGRNLLVSQEIMQAEEQILLSLGVSRELLSGTTNWTSSSVGLRMMENSLFSYTSRLQDLIDWIIFRVSGYVGMTELKTSLIPFKLLDDDNVKNMLFQLNGQGKASTQTLFEELGMDYTKELERIQEEAVNTASAQITTQFKVEQAQFLSARKAGGDFKEDEDFKNSLDKAQSMAEQIYQMDEGGRRSFLMQLKAADYAQWLMVSKIIDEMNKSAEHQQQVQNEAAQMVDQQAQQGNIGSGDQPNQTGAEAQSQDQTAQQQPQQ